MSKQTGNFLTLSETVDMFSADGMRISLAVNFFIEFFSKASSKNVEFVLLN